MEPAGRVILVLGIVVGSGGCGDQAKTYERVRGPAVAGSVAEEPEPKLFYPREPGALAKMVDQFLADAGPEPVKNVRGLVCPHAGYEYSGKTAAFGYKLLKGRDARTVIVMGPSHYASAPRDDAETPGQQGPFEGASIPDVDAYETPLGLIPLSPHAAELAKLKPFVVNPPCEVRRPAFWRYSPRELPPFGEDTPHTWEHSVEVQLPFLQRTLNGFSLVPIVFGQVDPEAVAQQLLKYVDDETLIVASSDLSHYLPQEVAKGLDATCCRAICSLNTGWLERQDACGKGPILTLMHVARQKGWKAKLLDYRTSGDVTGDMSRGVVGYAAIAFYEPQDTTPSEAPGDETSRGALTPQEQKSLLELARETITGIANRTNVPSLGTSGVAEKLTEPAACFVTLKKDGKLRGCIGDIFPRRPLYQAVIFSAANAAFRDQRFRPVQSDELDQIEIEVSLLTLPKPLEFKSPDELLEKLRPHVDGVVLRVGRKQAVYLPQVWEQMPDKEEFLNRLAEKAGLNRSDWRSPKAQILVYQVEAFKESER